MFRIRSKKNLVSFYRLNHLHSERPKHVFATLSEIWLTFVTHLRTKQTLPGKKVVDMFIKSGILCLKILVYNFYIEDVDLILLCICEVKCV